MVRSSRSSARIPSGPLSKSHPLVASHSPERWIGLALGPIALAALVLGWFTR